MAEITGSGAYVAFAGTEISADYRTFDHDESIDIVDASAGADVARTYLKTLEDGSASMLILRQADGTASTDPWQVLDKGAEGTLEWAEEGTATGKPKHFVNTIITNRNKAIPYDDLVVMNFDFQFSGEVTDGTY